MIEQFTFFWSGIFSQWYTAPFIINGIPYNCAEQYMMQQKALTFNDFEIALKVMCTKNPREQKALGRQVKNFKMIKWAEVARDIVYTGNYAKFTKNPELYEQLIATQGTTLVEASPKDTLWGIGLAEDDPRALNRETWLGKNWLGEVLTKVRDDIIKSSEDF